MKPFGNCPLAFQRRDLGAQDLQDRRIFIAHVEVDAFGFDEMRRDQRAFEHAVRIALQVIAVLERARLALIAVDRHQARSGIRANKLPFLSRRKARAAETAQSGIGQHLRKCLEAERAGTHPHQPCRSRHWRNIRRGRHRPAGSAQNRDWPFRSSSVSAIRARLRCQSLGRRFAPPARHRNRPCMGRERCVLPMDRRPPAIAAIRCLGAGEHARQRIADADRQWWRRRLVFLDDIEMIVERGDFIDLGLRQPQPIGQRAQMPRRKMAELVLDTMQAFNQQVAPIAACRRAAHRYFGKRCSRRVGVLSADASCAGLCRVERNIHGRRVLPKQISWRRAACPDRNPVWPGISWPNISADKSQPGLRRLTFWNAPAVPAYD